MITEHREHGRHHALSKKAPPRKAHRAVDDRPPGQSSGCGHKRRSCHFAPVSFRAGSDAASRGTVIRPNHNNNPAGAVSSIGSSFSTVTAVRTGVNKPRSGPGKPAAAPPLVRPAGRFFLEGVPSERCRGGDIYERASLPRLSNVKSLESPFTWELVQKLGSKRTSKTEEEKKRRRERLLRIESNTRTLLHLQSMHSVIGTNQTAIESGQAQAPPTTLPAR